MKLDQDKLYIKIMFENGLGKASLVDRLLVNSIK